jgi:hypothetical protein
MVEVSHLVLLLPQVAVVEALKMLDHSILLVVLLVLAELYEVQVVVLEVTQLILMGVMVYIVVVVVAELLLFRNRWVVGVAEQAVMVVMAMVVEMEAQVVQVC